jgi:hypothetical protein
MILANSTKNAAEIGTKQYQAGYKHIDVQLPENADQLVLCT